MRHSNRLPSLATAVRMTRTQRRNRLSTRDPKNDEFALVDVTVTLELAAVSLN